VLTEGASHPLTETNGVYRPDPELFIRWSQYGLLCSHGRFHGMLGREPWLFGDEAVDVIKRFIALRTELRPYLIEQAEVAAETGCPVMRPIALEFPDDPGARNVDTEFLLGPGLLVAPVLEPGGDVELYVPEGRWTDQFTGAVYNGPCWVRLEAVPIDRIPLLVRDGYTPFGVLPSGEPG
jgi:alpha-D-xyloside xylohydrolase